MDQLLEAEAGGGHTNGTASILRFGEGSGSRYTDRGW